MRRWTALVALALLANGAAPPPPGMSAAETRGRIAAAIGKGDGPEVSAAAGLLALMGGGLSEEDQARLAPFLAPGQVDLLGQRFAANAEPVAASGVFAQIPVEHRLVEGIAHDPRTGRLFAGTVVDGTLLVTAGLGWRAAALPGRLGGLFGMRVDAGRRRLWIAVGRADQVADKASVRPGVLEVDLDTLAPLGLRPVPAGDRGSPGDVAIGADGTVYASDGLAGGIYRCPPGCAVLERLVAPGWLNSPRGMVPSRDGTALIVADHAGGLARVDLPGGEIAWMELRDAAMLDGIGALMRQGDALVAIQTGTSPRRIVRITLDEQEMRVDAVDVIERANPAWGELALGTVSEDRLIYVADAQRAAYGPGGALNEGETPGPTVLRAVPLPLR